MAIPGKHEIDNPQLKALVQDIGRTLTQAMPPNYGYALVIFGYTTHDLFYASNTERGDVVRLFKEAIAKLEPLG